MVPLSVTLAVTIGAAVAGAIRLNIDPSGIVQSTLTTPIAEQLDTQNVAVLFGAPYAALAAALISHFGLRRHHPWIYAVLGLIAGVLVFAFVGFEALVIGQWW